MKPDKRKLPLVPKAIQGGETLEQYSWVERAAWTKNMLAALQRGVTGGMWFSLNDKVCSQKNLLVAAQKVCRKKGAAGVDRQSTKQFHDELERNVERLRLELLDNSYDPRPIRRTHIPKMGSSETRPLGIPSVRDRVVQQALKQVLEPIFEDIFIEHSYGFRPQRSCKDALRRVQKLLNDGYTWVVDADFSSYFDTIDHDLLMKEVKKKVADGKTLGLLEKFLKQSVMEGCKEWQPEIGSPQGAVVSPLLANIFLHPVDMALVANKNEIVRYADDLVILCRSEAEAKEALQLLHSLAQERGLTLHPKKTKLVDATVHGGFDFLGYHFERGYRWPRDKSVKKLRDNVRQHTRRTNGQSLEYTITKVNRVLRGWFNYFKHGLRNILEALDKWVRMRLRSILRKNRKRKGRGRGLDHHRWPNAFFRNHGLFFLTEAQDSVRQS